LEEVGRLGLDLFLTKTLLGIKGSLTNLRKVKKGRITLKNGS